MRHLTSWSLALSLSLLVAVAVQAQPKHGPKHGPRPLPAYGPKSCPPDAPWSATHHRCIRPTTCPPGWMWSVYYEKCVQRDKCPPDTRFTGHGCTPWKQCPDGSYFNSQRKRCVPDLSPCPEGYHYRAGWGCQPRCPAGYFLSEGSCKQVEKACPPGQFYSGERNRCMPNCRMGTYWDYRGKACRRQTW